MRRLETRRTWTSPSISQYRAAGDGNGASDAQSVKDANVAQLIGGDGRHSHGPALFMAKARERRSERGIPAKENASEEEKFKRINIISTPPPFTLRNARTATLSGAVGHPDERTAEKTGSMTDFCVLWRSWKNNPLYVPPPDARVERKLSDAEQARIWVLLQPIVDRATFCTT